MAGEETTNQGNIRQEYNAATTGLNMDQTVNQIQKGRLTYALNASVENFDANSVNYQNEPGNEFCVQFPTGYQLIGTHFISEKNKHIFFLANPTDGGSQIGYMDNNDCTYRVLVDAPCLNFNIHYPIHKSVHRITNCNTEVYWTDGYNPRRYIDIENVPYVLKPGTAFCEPEYTNEVDCNQLKVQPNFSIPQLAVVDITTGGTLTAGTYQFAVQYSDAAGNPYTSYYSITNPTPIANTQLASVNFDYTVGRSIVLNISELDSSGQFQYFNVAVIKSINGISSVELIGTYFIDNTQKQITYTGQIVADIRLSINDIFEKFPYYEIAQDLTAVQGVLVWDQLTSIDRINYQSIASQITLGWESWRIPADQNYADATNATNLRGYLRDEVYAFEIVFLLKNGKQTDGFHIPGRIKGPVENNQPPVPTTNDDFIGEPDASGTSPYWKIYNTATVTGTSAGYDPADPGYKGPYQYGEFAYWESSELYPCNKDVWGDLADTPIRHHKFPDVAISPIFESKLFLGPQSMVMGNDAVFPIGVRIDVQQVITLINASNLTDEQKADIIGFKIVRGDRGTNKSIIAKGILRNVNTYNRDEQTYYFPNYPYNDLSQDPFLNSSNNAYTQLCDTYEVQIDTLGVDPDGGPDFAELLYTDCNTNKQVRKKFYVTGSFEWCSTSQPIVLGPAVGRAGVANYEIWRASRNNWLSRGYRIAWEDRFNGASTRWINGWPNPQNVEILQVVPNTGGVRKIGGNGTANISYVGFHTADLNCKVPSPLSGIETNGNLAYRQIFNSPETSFGQPFLGDILKLESVIFGSGRAHFVQVKSNAKYKLLTEEAQRDALDSSNTLGNHTDPFNATAMFTAYQAYLTIYINGITRKNYAYSFNSIADYNYTVGVPNDLGIKQRNLDIARYLIPGVQNVGDDHDINNYNRESSVFLKTDPTKPYLPFPDKSPNMVVGGNSIVTDDSRFIISDKGNCNAPGKEEYITAVSYYGSLKIMFINQYGQMYSYDTIDTGFQRKVDSGTATVETIFGGDTFISRFAFKTKLPFFIDDRVNAPDDSDIFYDEIGNVGYPVYWHSARSILRDYTINGVGVLSNIISYKAHNFDCPNSQVLAPGASAQTNPDRTFYDGYFYMFAYGIPNFYCESSYNTDLRQAFNNREGDFWPHVSTGIPDDWVQQSFVPIAQDNTYYYNVTYSKQNKENIFTHLPPDWKQQLCYTNYPFRAIYSDTQQADADNKVNNWLTYRAVSYFDFPQNYGKLTSLDGIQNRAVLARFENKSLLYNNLLTIDTSNPQAAYVGNDKLFAGAPPIDFAETDLGYVGSQHKMLLKIPQGQITIDAKRGQVFLIAGTDAVDISAFGTGMNRFFTDHLAFEILRYFPDADIDNNFNGLGLHGVYDSKYDRVIITKLDYIPRNKSIKYDAVNREFYIEKVYPQDPIPPSTIPPDPIVIRETVYLTDEEYFCNKSWTLSYNMNTKSWISFHSYIPNWYIAENNFFYSGINGCCDGLDATAGFEVLAGKVVPDITTTTTTTSSTTTTSTTTTTYTGCDLGGVITLTNCELEGTAVITVPPVPAPCVRPSGLNNYFFISGYTITSAATTIVSTATQDDACAAVTFLNGFGDDYVDLDISVVATQTAGIAVGNPVYVDNGSTDCEMAPDGWYFTEEGIFDQVVFNVSGGYITEIASCFCGTTTTTTTIVNIPECCGMITSSETSPYYYDYNNNAFAPLTIGSFTGNSPIAMTANKLWEVSGGSSWNEWDITLSPFTATFSTNILFPGGFSSNAGYVALTDTALIGIDQSGGTDQVTEIDLTGPNAFTIFALSANRSALGNLLYTIDRKLIVLNQDTITSDYYVSQYDYITNALEIDVVLTGIVPTGLFECNCDIYITDDANNVFLIDRTSPYGIIDVTDTDVVIKEVTQVVGCITTSLSITTTTTTSSSTTTTTTTVPPGVYTFNFATDCTLVDAINVYSDCSSLTLGCAVYTDIALTVYISNGIYSDGVYIYTLEDGGITNIQPCEA